MRTLIRRRAALTIGLAAGALAAPIFARPARAQALWRPNGVARIVVPFAAGGTADTVAHVVAEILAAATHTPFIIDNKAGAGGDVGAEIVARAAPDGRTLLLGHVGTAVINQHLHKYIPYDSVESFAPVAQVGEVANVLVVHPSVRVSSLKEFVDLCKARGRGKMSYGSPAIGSVGHLTMEYLQSRTDMKLTHVAYRSRSRMIRDLLAGEIQVTMDNLPAYLQHVDSGALRALAVSSASRWFAASHIPTIAEQGYGEFDATLWWYIAAPACTPVTIVQQLSDAVVEGMKSEALVGRMRRIGVLERPRCTLDLAKHVDAENAKWKEVIAAAQLKRQ